MAKQAREPIHAVAYLRTSSAANVGADKDSERRQREAIQGFAKRSGYQILDEFYDAAVSGADAIDARAGFAAMLKRIEANGVRTIIVETASRFKPPPAIPGSSQRSDHKRQGVGIPPRARRGGGPKSLTGGWPVP